MWRPCARGCRWSIATRPSIVMITPLPLPQSMCLENWNRHHAAKNNILHPMAVWMMRMCGENITVASAENIAWHPRQTSYEEGGGGC